MKQIRAYLKTIFVLIVVVCVGLAFLRFDTQTLFLDLLEKIKDLGFFGGIVFALVYVTACILLLPGSILTLGAGFVYKLFWGTILVSAASTIGATSAFLIGRYFARNWVSQKIEKYPKFQAIDRAVAKEGWKIVGLTRLSPVFPFNLLNYAYGLTSVSLREYVLASWIGMFPGTLMYVYFGSLAGSLAMLGSGNQSGSGVKLMLSGIGLVATIAVTVVITRTAKKALAEYVEAERA